MPAEVADAEVVAALEYLVQRGWVQRTVDKYDLRGSGRIAHGRVAASIAAVAQTMMGGPRASQADDDAIPVDFGLVEEAVGESAQVAEPEAAAPAKPVAPESAPAPPEAATPAPQRGPEEAPAMTEELRTAEEAPTMTAELRTAEAAERAAIEADEAAKAAADEAERAAKAKEQLEQAAAEKAEAARLARARAEVERVAAEEAEGTRREEEKARVEAEQRVAAERAAEEKRLGAERAAEQKRLEAERLAAEEEARVHSGFVERNGTVYFSIITGEGHDGELPESALEQSYNILATLEAAMADANVRARDIVRVMYVVKDREDLVECTEVFSEAFRAAKPAASVVIAELFHPDARFAIDVTAVRGAAAQRKS